MAIETSNLLRAAKVDTLSRVPEEVIKPSGPVELLQQLKAKDEEGEKGKKPDSGQLEGVLGRLNLMLEMTWYDLHFRIHEATHEVMVQVVNRDTGEVLREIPPQRILDMVAEMMRLIGMMMDEKV
ncbi:MAG: flagellar protein FlaG [Ammonifex sp.]|jgi:flagellar protein FlaG|nr:MAG: flagellar protein FlaG [Ammonifex sp.]